MSARHPAWPVVLLILPAVIVAALLWMRAGAGPFWIWHTLDPSYYYLFDALNVANLTTPGNFYHPGTTVQAFGALVLKAAHPAASGDALSALVLADAEASLRLLSNAMIAVVVAAVLAAGWIVYRALDDVFLAVMVQAAPLLSMLTFKNAYHVRPEPFLVIASLALIAATAMALKPGALDRHRLRFAVAFGVIAGFGVATKVTAAPVFVLPLFLLGNVRALAAYVGVAAASLVVFTLPTAGNYADIVAYLTRVATSAGVYGSGAQTVVDVGAYPHAVVKLFKRPLLSVSVILSGAALIWAWVRHRRGHPVPGPEVRALGGLVLALVLHVLVVAKQPAAFYLVPSYVLAALAVVLVYRLVAALGDWTPAVRNRARWTVIALFAAAMAGRVPALVKQDKELRALRADATTAEAMAFPNCARVYYYAASTPAYALYLGDYVGRLRHTAFIRHAIAPNEFWLNDYFADVEDEIRGPDGPVSLRSIAASFPCMVFRGLRGRGSLKPFVARELPGREFDADCSVGHEEIVTMGVDCPAR